VKKIWQNYLKIPSKFTEHEILGNFRYKEDCLKFEEYFKINTEHNFYPIFRIMVLLDYIALALSIEFT